AAFDYCSHLTNLVIGTAVTNIGNSAFSSCTSLPRIIIPDNLIHLETRAFASCDSLTNVHLGKAVADIADDTFLFCPRLASITVDPGNTVYSDQAGVLFNQAKTALLLYPGGLTGNYTVPSEVTAIAPGAFRYDNQLTGVAIPDSVTNI